MNEAMIEKIADVLDGYLKDDFDTRSIFHRNVVGDAVRLAAPLIDEEANLLAVERDVALVDWRRAVAERDAANATVAMLRDEIQMMKEARP